MMGKTIFYVRVSTEEQNPENQIRDCEKINKWGEYEVIEDKQSAYKDNIQRNGFERLRSLIKKGKVNSLIVWDLDRIYRNRKKLKEFFEFCKVYKCAIHSVNQQWLEELHKIPEPFNEIMHSLMLNLMGWLAEDESKKKSDRVKLAVRKKGGVTKSYKGNKWGRKALSPQKKNKVIEYYNNNPKAKIREIAKELGLSKSVVHKYIQIIKGKKTDGSEVHKLTNLRKDK